MSKAKTNILKRVGIVYTLTLIFGIAIVIKILYIQIYLSDELLEKAREQEIKVFGIDAMRGNILSDDGALLATTVPVFEVRMDVASPLIVDTAFNNNIHQLAAGLAGIFNSKSQKQYLNELKEARREGNRYFLIKRVASYAEVKKLRKLPIFNKGKYSGGLILIPGHKRENPYKQLAARTIGYTNEKFNVFVGIEGAYHEYLKGFDGKQVKRRINNGDWKPLFDENMVEPKNGKDIITTIDVNIQDVAESALQRVMTEHFAQKGCAVLMEVETGRIVALANLIRDKSGNLTDSYNFAIAESIEPGSTFKLASFMVLIEDKKIRLYDTINIGNGQMQFGTRTMRDVYPIRNGRITIREAFEKSSNVAISKMIYNAYNSNPEVFIDKLYAMSLNQPLDLQIPGEGKVYIKHPSKKKYWYASSLPWMSTGYEILMSPMHILTFYNAVANNGKMMKPLLVKEIRQDNIVLSKFDPVVINPSVASKSTIDSVKSLMEGVVAHGSAKFLSHSPYKIAGKTGTAQIADGKKGYNKDDYNASFVGYFPAGNPKYSCIVVISKPKAGKIYGGAVAAPVFREIADKVYATRPNIHDGLKIAQNDSVIIPTVHGVTFGDNTRQLFQQLGLRTGRKTPIINWAKVSVNEFGIEFASIDIQVDSVPNVAGMTAKEAIYLLETIGLKAIVKGKGTVVSQSVAAGQPVSKGTIVELHLAKI